MYVCLAYYYTCTIVASSTSSYMYYSTGTMVVHYAYMCTCEPTRGGLKCNIQQLLRTANLQPTDLDVDLLQCSYLHVPY